MKILLTGATGYIGKRLLPQLLSRGHEIIAVVRDAARFQIPQNYSDQVKVLEHDFIEDYNGFIPDVDVAYYLIHSMSSGFGDFDKKEALCAENFVKFIDTTSCKQIVYLSGLTNQEKLSKHLKSRQNTGAILGQSRVPLTELQAGIIVGSGSASFEIIRDLVEKLPVMVAPRWLETKCQPIGIRTALQYLTGVIEKPETRGNNYQIGGPDILTYKQMLLQYAEVRELKRAIFSVPVMTPKLSSYWLYFVTSTTYSLAVNLVDSMKVEVVCEENRIREIIDAETLSYKKNIELAFTKIEQNSVVSSWKDAAVSGLESFNLGEFIGVPQFGCFRDVQKVKIQSSVEKVKNRIWCIGGKTGWYYGNFLWQIRGLLDKVNGGVGLRRGRTDPEKLSSGDALDFWRVLDADYARGRLLLYAEMKLPGEAWLEFQIEKNNGVHYLVQTATFRPKGLWGRIYWYAVTPFHWVIFKGMAGRIVE